jgi:hypothetical protein
VVLDVEGSSPFAHPNQFADLLVEMKQKRNWALTHRPHPAFLLGLAVVAWTPTGKRGRRAD